jgi:uncharacterized membrane protein YkgB
VNALTGIGQAISRYGLALTLAWIGFGKYIKMESRQFLLKDVVLLGVAVWTLGEAVQAHRASSAFDADREEVGDSPRP